MIDIYQNAAILLMGVMLVIMCWAHYKHVRIHMEEARHRADAKVEAMAAKPKPPENYNTFDGSDLVSEGDDGMYIQKKGGKIDGWFALEKTVDHVKPITVWGLAK